MHPVEGSESPATTITPALLVDDDDLRDALAVACEGADGAELAQAVGDKMGFLQAKLDDGTFAIVVELVELITRRHEEIVFVVVRGILWSWAESDAANGVSS